MDEFTENWKAIMKNEMEENKTKIEEFVQSLLKNREFNNYGLEELSKHFVTELCKQNAEKICDYQIKQILAPQGWPWTIVN